METIEKIDVRKMKADIKTKVEEQRFYKNQRRTVKLVGERKIHPNEASWKHHANRHTLRLMYAAYGLARGKSFVQIESNSKWEKVYEDSTYDECHPLRKYQGQIDKILEQYKYQFVTHDDE
jgi:hypothetical protein